MFVRTRSIRLLQSLWCLGSKGKRSSSSCGRSGRIVTHDCRKATWSLLFSLRVFDGMYVDLGVLCGRRVYAGGSDHHQQHFIHQHVISGRKVAGSILSLSSISLDSGVRSAKAEGRYC
jgi:hypothetical protein